MTAIISYLFGSNKSYSQAADKVDPPITPNLEDASKHIANANAYETGRSYSFWSWTKKNERIESDEDFLTIDEGSPVDLKNHDPKEWVEIIANELKDLEDPLRLDEPSAVEIK